MNLTPFVLPDKCLACFCRGLSRGLAASGCCHFACSTLPTNQAERAALTYARDQVRLLQRCQNQRALRVWRLKFAKHMVSRAHPCRPKIIQLFRCFCIHYSFLKHRHPSATSVNVAPFEFASVTECSPRHAYWISSSTHICHRSVFSYESFSTLGVQPTLRPGCLEKLVLGLLRCMLGCSLAGPLG